ncbi:sulfite exporter TauE/SafE family protein [Nocardioides halotolerans]|uniref:sulfite exporter TauE/SafE family protein n=1 Tax=Nocardioides halotolerans TaxID=433660 RepID=UPI00040FC4F0|nr:sulfite exporter TauE/SafE family protein [Nocardioides halotolerans]
MSLLEAIAIGLAGLAAGTINTVVGSGTLITFPTLLAFGVPPVTANVSNTIGLVPGSVSGVVGYRRELTGQRSRVLRIGVASLLGGVLGAVLLLVLPEGAFSAIVPVLVGLGILLVVFQPRITAWVEARHDRPGMPARDPVVGARWVWPAVLGAGVYGGYFGAAQGVLLMGVMGVGIPETLQRLNALKNVLAAIVNAVAGLLFAVVADVDWRIVALIGVGSVIGGQVGATVGRRLPSPVLRGTIVVVGIVALAVFLLG